MSNTPPSQQVTLIVSVGSEFTITIVNLSASSSDVERTATVE